MLSLRHPDLFRVFGDYSGLAQPTLDPPRTALADLFGGNPVTMDSYDPLEILPSKRFPTLAGWFETGSHDAQPLASTRHVSRLAIAAGITTCVSSPPGGHDFALWHEAFLDSLPWMSAQLGLTPLPVDVHGATCTGPATSTASSG